MPRPQETARHGVSAVAFTLLAHGVLDVPALGARVKDGLAFVGRPQLRSVELHLLVAALGALFLDLRGVRPQACPGERSAAWRTISGTANDQRDGERSAAWRCHRQSCTQATLQTPQHARAPSALLYVPLHAPRSASACRVPSFFTLDVPWPPSPSAAPPLPRCRAPRRRETLRTRAAGCATPPSPPRTLQRVAPPSRARPHAPSPTSASDPIQRAPRRDAIALHPARRSSLLPAHLRRAA